MLQRMKGFKVSNSISTCTKGIFIWNQVIPGTYQGRPINILVADTEGFGSFESNANYDFKVFAMAILISTHFLYNNKSMIDNDAL